MINAEKYKDEILIKSKEYVGYNYPLFKAIDSIKGVYMDFNETIEWLLSEYEQPLLENGDSLKVGDWIMVKDSVHDDDWCKRQFTYYYNHKFYCAQDKHDLEYGKSYIWNYARLPEEGE